jgi:putative oxidoreductase
VSFGVLLLRLVVGGLFIGHGTQKLFGWFDGPGREGTTAFMNSLGYPNPRRMAVLAGGTEAVAGLLLVVGLFTPVAGAMIVGVMINAIVTVHKSNGPWNSDGGYEYNLVLGTTGAMFGFVGAGAASLDEALDLGMAGALWGVATLTLGLLTAGAVLAMRQPAGAGTLADEEREEERQVA